MATTIRKLTRAKKPSRYPWKLWTDGKPRRARKSKDFRCSVNGFRNTLYTHAERNKLRVSVSVKGKLVEFQFRASEVRP